MDHSLNRRQLLRLGIPAAVWGASGSGLYADDPQDRDVDVLVVGAGASGLAAAKELSSKYKVVVLEARDRIGGRVWSDRPWGDVTLDMGASWIHGIRGNPIHALAQQLQIKTHPTSGERHWLWRDDGHEYEDKEQAVTETRVKTLLQEVRALRKPAMSRGDPDSSLQAALDPLIARHAYTPLQLREIDFQLSSLIEGFTAATFARRVERHTDEQTITGMLAALRSMFGRNKVPDPTDAKITRWAADPFSFGSYSFLKTGATPQDYDRLAEPVAGRLFFAGEHTARRYAATVHGAYLSGLRAAKQVAAQAST